jgi:hypothetical protein
MKLCKQEMLTGRLVAIFVKTLGSSLKDVESE